jgi:hypothetical protein
MMHTPAHKAETNPADQMRKYVERGLRCALWGIPTQDMTATQLIGFIGVMDELLEKERAQKTVATVPAFTALPTP